MKKKLIALGMAIFSTHAFVANATTIFDSNTAYAEAGSMVRYFYKMNDGNYKVADFKNKWYTNGKEIPEFYPNNGPWQRTSAIIITSNVGDVTSAAITGDSITEEYHAGGSYAGGSKVKSEGGTCYQSQWWTTSKPGTGNTVWSTITCPISESITLSKIDNIKTPPSGGDDTGGGGDQCSSDGSNIPVWNKNGIYTEGNLVKMGGNYYKAKWWNQGKDNTPPTTEPAIPWDSPWTWYGSTCVPVSDGINGSSATLKSDETLNGLSSDTTIPPTANLAGSDTEATNKAADNTKKNNTPVVPPVIPKKAASSSVKVATEAPVTLPDTGYAFLRLVTDEDWDWLFPMRSGKLVPGTPCTGGQQTGCGGGSRNTGDNDTFTLKAFTNAVLEYNHWAKANNYKQFLNEGTLKQQEQEFLVFWAKSSRETSGTWSTAKVPWIVNEKIGGEDIVAWKGALYWVEEVGYSTDPATGKSAAINYVDAGSSEYPPQPGRSYYGRGVIQLSWNYNYGAFSYWLYDNGILKNVIDSRDKLLHYPNLVADNGELSIISGIWFWMTPQGAKPSSHDVLYGDVDNISASTQDQGLPQSNILSSTNIPVAKGDTTDQAVYAYRLGSIINIVNGGLECNKAAGWHPGPVQRVLYYDAYTAYFNDKYSLNAVRIDDAKASSSTAWSTKVSQDSPANLQSATCYNQKSYYGW